MIKRNKTPLSVNNRRKVFDKIPRPRKRKITSDESDKLILPALKDNTNEKITKNDDVLHNHFYPKIKSSKQNGKKININNVLSPIKTELKNNKKKRGSRDVDEISSKYFIKLSEKNNSKNKDKNSKEKNSKEKYSSKNVNLFNKSNNKKNTNNIKTEFLPSICSSKSKSAIKFPLIETNIHQIKSDKKLNNKIVNTCHHKYKSDTLLNSEYILENKKYATHTINGIEEEGKNKENNQDVSIILNDVCEIENYSIYGIMDGHGSNGHLVSNFVKEKIEEYFNDRKIYKQKKLAKYIEI